MVRVGIIGASGYTGVELLRIVAGHPGMELVCATGDTQAGTLASSLYPSLAGAYPNLVFSEYDPAVVDGLDLVFLGLPHEASMAIVPEIAPQVGCIVDLSAAYRLKDASAYPQWYGFDHTQPAELARAVYGLPELHRSDIAAAQLIANPGCYPTTVALGAMPLLEAGALADATIIADAKSGVSGAGRKPAQSSHFVEVNESLNPYGIAGVHRHIPEMEQTLAAVSGAMTPRVIFTPHLLPISRGMLTTLYFTLTDEAAKHDWQAIFEKRYEGEPFVRVLPKGQIATIAHTTHSNRAVLSVHPIAGMPNRLLVVSCLDNLVKGASGQAVQNMNLMFGLDEAAGLE